MLRSSRPYIYHVLYTLSVSVRVQGDLHVHKWGYVCTGGWVEVAGIELLYSLRRWSLMKEGGSFCPGSCVSACFLGPVNPGD